MKAAPPEDLIVANHLSRVIGPRTAAVRILGDVSLRVPRVSLFPINGPSGSGKSTLLNMITGIDHPTSGEILFDGQPISGRSENALVAWRGVHVGIVFQFFQLISTLSAFESVLLALELGGGGGLPKARWRERAARCLDLVEMSAYHRRLPSELSGGQHQRVAIARALANDPPLLVADEPTGNLDSRTPSLPSSSSRGAIPDPGRSRWRLETPASSRSLSATPSPSRPLAEPSACGWSPAPRARTPPPEAGPSAT